MRLGARRAAPVALLVACALAAPVAHADDRLVGAMAQVQDPSTGDLPPLTDDPPTPLGTPTATPTADGTATPTASASPGQEELARTGSEAGLAALAGLSLLGAGLSLRVLTVDGAPD